MDWPSTYRSIRTAESVREVLNEDGAVLLDINQGVCFSMNPVGAKIWEMLRTECSVDEIATALQSEFGVPIAQIKRDIGEFVEELKTHNLVSWES
jgi:hypothetical protein